MAYRNVALETIDVLNNYSRIKYMNLDLENM